MKHSLLTIVILFLTISAHAQMRFSDSLQVSLLTVEPGEQSFECFGHTAFRITDLKTGKDVVFHYGVYDYTEPNFILHFVEGKCNYRMGGCYMSDFMEEHRRRQLSIDEQVLWLDSAQTRTLVDALNENYRPQNRNYRYNFFFDNCATRPFQMLNRCAAVHYDTAWVQPVTLRDMLHEKTGKGQWLDFGIALAVTGRADQRATFTEQMFLPDHLSTAIDHATLDGHPLVRREGCYPLSKEEKGTVGAWLVRPATMGWWLFAIGALATLLGLRRPGDEGHRPTTFARSFDTLWLALTGLTGCIIWFLNFCSEHPAVDHNLNCLWLLPTNLLFIAFIWTKKGEKVRRIYFFIIFAAVILYIISVCVSAQYFHPAFLPLIATLLLRSTVNLIRRK